MQLQPCREISQIFLFQMHSQGQPIIIALRFFCEKNVLQIIYVKKMNFSLEKSFKNPIQFR
jgi:hypothetical protein